MIDRVILGLCGFQQCETTMFFASNVETWYHPSGLWVPFSEDPNAELLNSDQFSDGDIVVDGDACSTEDFYHVFIQHISETAFLRGYEEGLRDGTHDDYSEYDNEDSLEEEDDE